MDALNEGVGYIKLVGSSVEDGSVGAEAAGKALLALDDLLKYFNRQQSKGFSSLPYEITVKTKEGSWEVLVLGGIGIFAGAYIKKAAEKMAERDFADVGFKDVLRKSIDAIRWLVKLVKHTKGTLDFASTEISWKISEGKVGVENYDGETMYVPIEYFKWYFGISKSLLKGLTQPIEENRTLIVASEQDGGVDEVEVNLSDIIFFGHEDVSSEEEFLFPELEHGQKIELEGRLTRGNENTNSLGLEYAGHVLNCVPETGSITQFKPALFLKCRVFATVSRLVKQHVEAERRPTLIISHVAPLESDDQLKLFGR